MTMRHWLLSACVCLLGACSGAQRRDAPPPTAPTPPTAAASAVTAAETAPKKRRKKAVVPAPAPIMPAEPDPIDLPFWQAITTRYAFSDCDDRTPAVRRWQRIYVQSPQRFAESMAQVAPWLGYVADELARRGLPAEFVWLPYVESRYQAVRTHGDRPAGVWQLMPATARWRGLRIDADYDGRLDFVAATDAALDLLEHLAQVFERNWALVTMAYNAGEYRIKGALARARSPGAAPAPEKLAVSPITHEHLVKLRALACIAATPDAFGLQLPAFDRAQQLAPLAVSKPFPVVQLATLSGVSMPQWMTWNPGWRHGRVDAGAQILLPRRLLDQRAQAIAAAAPEVLAPLPIAAVGDGRVHVVRGGESAWTIARRYRIALSALLDANGLTPKSVLKPGQRLLLP